MLSSSSSPGWFDWAQRMDGPANKKVLNTTNLIDGVVFHSAVGTLQGVINVVMGPASNQKSVTGVLAKDGRFIQFYPVTASPWANGNPTVNVRYLGFEFEGGPLGNESEPLTLSQVEGAVRILKDLAEYKGVSVDFWRRPVSLVEHKELVATACPSGRIPWTTIIAALVEAPPVASKQQRIDAIVKELLQVNNGWKLSDLPPNIVAILDEMVQEAKKR